MNPRNIFYNIFSSEFILNRLRKIRLHNRIIVLMYHEIAFDSDEIEAWTVVKKSEFIKQMEYLLRYFNVVSLKDAINHMNKTDDELNAQKPMVVITFDDGYKGNMQVLLPIIKSLNLPVTIFCATKAIQDQSLYWYDRLINSFQGGRIASIDLTHLSLGKYPINIYKDSENWREIEKLLSDLKTLEPHVRGKAVEDILSELNLSQDADYYKLAPLSIQELRELSESPLVTIGAHSHCHNLLDQLSYDAAETSITTSKQLIESWIGRPVIYFAYPNGNYNDKVIDITNKAGFKCSMTTKSKPYSHADSLFTIPRIGIGRYDSCDLFKMKVSGL